MTGCKGSADKCSHRGVRGLILYFFVSRFFRRQQATSILQDCGSGLMVLPDIFLDTNKLASQHARELQRRQPCARP